MNEAELFLKQAVLFLILALAVFLPFRINFSRNYFVVYIISVLLFCWFYASLFFGFDMRSIGTAGSMLTGCISEKIGSIDFDKSMEAFVQKKNELVEKFQRSGLTKEEIALKLESFHDQAIEEYASQVHAKIRKEIRFLSGKDGNDNLQNTEINNEIDKNFNLDPKSLLDVSGIDEMIKELKEKGFYSEEIKTELNKLRRFILDAKVFDFSTE